MSRNFGGVPCKIAGFEHACGDAIIYFDIDLQDPPEIFPELIKKFEEGYDVVHTVRKKRLGETRFKIFLTRMAYKIINFLSETNFKEESGDFKLLSRKALNSILISEEKDPYLRGLSVWIGYRQFYLEFIRQPRKYGNSKYSIFQSIPEFIRGITSFSVKPLYLGVSLGFLSILVSIGLIIFSIITKILNVTVPGVSSILIALSFFFGVIMLNIGLLGIYVDIRKLASLLGKKYKVNVLSNKINKIFVDSYVPNIHKAKKYLNLKIKYNSFQAVSDVINNLKKNG